jgi:hypothetical protein
VEKVKGSEYTVNVPIWGSDSISDWLNAPPLISCGASPSNVFTSSIKQIKSVYTSMENDKKNKKKNFPALSLSISTQREKGDMSCSDAVEMSERLLLIPCANSLELCLSQAHWHRKL